MSLLTAYITMENEARNANLPEGYIAMTTVTDVDHWARQGIYTPKQYDMAMLESEYSDAFKECNGMRPRWAYGTMSAAELKAGITGLYEEIRVENLSQAEYEAEEAIKTQAIMDSVNSFKPSQTMALAFLRAA